MLSLRRTAGLLLFLLLALPALQGAVQAQTQPAVLFEEPERFDIVLVPLDHGPPGHGGVLDRDERRHRFVPEQEPARMNREMAGEVLDLA